MGSGVPVLDQALVVDEEDAVVLPAPAPARMQIGPCRHSTARRCSSFNPLKIASLDTASP
jgi:hypothetical protein